ncbi:MAG TPA: hypothetical protein VFX59_27980 [Polyangiales bacterium]|nr:hypothetical protein [Polyangiales bacterium]
MPTSDWPSVVLYVLIATLLLCVRVACAQDVPAETLLQSNALFAQGKRELDANQVPAACASFAESYRLLPRGGTLLNLGLCREREGRTAEAWRVLRAAQAVAQREGRDDRIPLAREHIALLEAQLTFAALALPHDIDPSLVALRLDGGAIAREEWNAVPLEPGEHVFSAEALGFQSWSTKLAIGAAPARIVVSIGPLVPNTALALENPAPTYQPYTGPYAYAPLRKAEDPGERAARLERQRLALEGWFAEFGMLITVTRDEDAYGKTLRAFDYDVQSRSRVGLDLGAGWMLSRRFGLTLHYSKLEARRYEIESVGPPKPNDGDRYVYSYHSQAVTAGARFRQPIVSHWVVFYAELTLGLAFTKSLLEYEVQAGTTYVPERDDKRSRAFALRALLGFQFGFTTHFGAFLAGGWTHAPTLENAIGETHDAGGPTILTGLRLNSVTGGW